MNEDERARGTTAAQQHTRQPLAKLGRAATVNWSAAAALPKQPVAQPVPMEGIAAQCLAVRKNRPPNPRRLAAVHTSSQREAEPTGERVRCENEHASTEEPWDLDERHGLNLVAGPSSRHARRAAISITGRDDEVAVAG